MSNSLFITAAIPTYKRPTQFRRALESVLTQTCPADQIVVGDDGAEQKVREICESYHDPRIIYIARQRARRMTDNWNFVTRWAEQGLVALLEDDNFWLPEHLENAKRLFVRFPDAGIYHAAHQEAWDCEGKLEIYKTYFPPWHEHLQAAGGGRVPTEQVVLDALICGSINSSTTVVRRGVFDQVPPFDHRYLMGMDTLMWTRLAMVSPCIYGIALDTVYTYHGKNVSVGEIVARRAGYQARASRRLISTEALQRGIISPERIKQWLERLPATEAAGPLTILAHRDTDPRLYTVARQVWKARADLRMTTGYLRASHILGWNVLGQADRIDTVLGKLGRFRQVTV